MLRSWKLGLQLKGAEEGSAGRGGEVRGSRSPGPRTKLDASDKASASCASPRRASRRARGAHAGGGSAARQSSARHRPRGPRAQLPPAATPPSARRPPGSAPGRAAHALRPPLKGPVRSPRVLRLSRPSLLSKLPLGWRWVFGPFSLLSAGAVKPCRAAGDVYNVPNGAQTPGRFRAREARGRGFLKGSTSQGPSGCRSENTAWKTGVLDRMQSLFSCGTFTRLLLSVGLSFPVCQPRSAHWVRAEPSRGVRSLQVGMWGLGSLPLGVEGLKVTLFHPVTRTSGSEVRKVRSPSASLDTALETPRPR